MKLANRRTIGYVTCRFARLNGPGAFYRGQLAEPEISQLLDHLGECAKLEGRRWFALAATHEKPERLRLTESPGAPEYEANAASLYLRGDIVRISGKEGSCNIDFSGQVGAALLADRIRCAQARMRRFVELRLPTRKRNLIELIPDVDLESADSPEHNKLALAGEALSANLGAAEEFSDWECQE